MNGQTADAGISGSQAQIAGLTNHRYVRWSIYALVAFPIVDYALRYLPGLHPLGAIWDKVVLLVLAIAACARYVSGVRPTWLRWQQVALLFILYVFALMFSDLSHPVMALEGFRMDIYYMLYPLLLPFLVEPDDVPKLLHAAALVAILVGVDGVYQYVMKTPIPSTWSDVNEQVRTRVFSVMVSPNEMGSYMAMMTPLVAGLALYERDKWRKGLYCFGVVVCGASLVFTMARGPWLALTLALLVVAALVERRLLIVLVIVAVIAFFLPPIHHRIADLFSPVYLLKASQSGRIAKWITAFGVMSGNPLFGAGLGHYGGAVASDFNYSTYSDNYYAKMLGETGLVGLTLFIALHLSLFADLFKHAVRRAAGRSKYVVIGGLIGLLAVLFHNFIENVFEYAPMVSIYFIYATLLLIWSRGFDGEVRHERT
ncbi:O-antigen ligase family protein [Alicyclobacillus cycloheptanicus]|uniref:O-antigen ligase n=1 Tax=Alicyclobacillus cycloheptanicus TaxID=1457 RepID=A0ABT9XJV4_9BACL|nr:O-antigen ligase family protein [Alicyclobacillus cycloheptanicus]MDQ0190585.1 O-antigen ligase [Alicyclobacillus cycloheptanicus]WDM01423.1 O-antigen ligase family protein [Alicyclobacillus cycloheptanicus]